MPLIIVVSAFAAFVSSGGAPRASIFMGKGDLDGAEKTLGGCFTMQIGISVVLTAALLLWGRPLLLVFGASENTIQYAVDYLNVYAIGTIFVQLTLGLNAFITAQGFATDEHDRTVLIGAAVNIVLDPIFIFVLNLGVRGAALATVISQGISCVWVVRFLNGKKTTAAAESGRTSSPGASWVVALCGSGAGRFYHAGQRKRHLRLLQLLPAEIRRGRGRGGHDHSVQRHAVRHDAGPGHRPGGPAHYQLQLRRGEQRAGPEGLPAAAGGVLGILPFCCGGSLSCFRRPSPGFSPPTRSWWPLPPGRLRVYCGVLFLFGIQIACQMTFVSIGNAVCSIIVAVLRKFVLLVPLIYLMPCLMEDKTMAVYMAEPVTDVHGRDLYRGSLCRPVPEGPEKAGGEGESLKFL